MREETRQILVEEEVYIADDGREFEDEDSCIAYEACIKLRKLKLLDSNFNPCDSIDDCWYVHLRTAEDVRSFIEACDYYEWSHSGIKGPGVYYYIYGQTPNGDAWLNLDKAIEYVKESEDFVDGN